MGHKERDVTKEQDAAGRGRFTHPQPIAVESGLITQHGEDGVFMIRVEVCHGFRRAVTKWRRPRRP